MCQKISDAQNVESREPAGFGVADPFYRFESCKGFKSHNFREDFNFFYKKQKIRALQDSNLRPLAPEANALSN